ncbi:MAG: HAD hydrolase-like protein [Synechococcaceae cyanobacterium SM2_3_1]|nr:HAD hydrolase-like protein [Synechococcaceae cyanobacterium SM2_3_1]
MVGDTTYDIEMALRAGVEAWAVGWGVHPPERLRQAGAHQLFLQSEDLVRHTQTLLA